MRRLPRERALWNRLGFPSQGAARVRDHLATTPLADVALAVNVAPHPLTVKSAESEPGFAARARAELFEIARLLHPWAAFFVLNASSPNTPGLRRQLEGGGFAQEIVAPLRAELLRLDAEARRIAPTFLLVKLPPEDAGGQAARPGRPRPAGEALPVRRRVRRLRRDQHLGGAGARGRARAPKASPPAASPARRSGRSRWRPWARWRRSRPTTSASASAACWIPRTPAPCVAAGAHLVELYTGLVYRGPRFARDCAAALRDHNQEKGHPLSHGATRRAGRAPEPK